MKKRKAGNKSITLCKTLVIILFIGSVLFFTYACNLFASAPEPVITEPPQQVSTPEPTPTPTPAPTPEPTPTPTPEPTPYVRVIDPELPMVALTFDDGPCDLTDQLLDMLEEHYAVATFYVLGRKVEDKSDTVLRAFDMGCEVANHSWSHPSLDRISSDRIHTQLQDTSDAIEAVTGVPPSSVRPTYGRTNSKLENVAQELGLPLVFWSIDPSDYLDRTPERIYDIIMDAVQDRDIILLHDIHERSIEAATMWVPSLIESGYQLVTVSELLEFSGITPEPGESYRHGRP